MDNQVTQTQQTEKECLNCGALLEAWEYFCVKCGAPVPDAPTFNQKARKIIIAIIAIVAVVVALVSVIAAISYKTPEELMEEGNYIKAYERADDSDKNRVLAENVIAVLSEDASDMLKNPSSFVLRGGYYKAWNDLEKGTFGQQAVLHITGTNSYGAAVSSYWVWVYNSSSSKWEYWGSATTTNIENDDEAVDILIKVVLKEVLETGIELEKTQVKNINAQFEADTLDAVELIPKSDIDKSLFPSE